ncbi:MAG: SulP family inorganic anion transporter [Verrucomicrobiae bacterium]|nr:SulP family inorganic anion transporter [Verrucomicrobiae bacterium]
MIQRYLTLPSFKSARRDVPAGIVVFLVALPLCLGIALASGAPLFAGIIGGVVGGVIVSLLSGSELSVSGPAAGLTVIVSAAIIKFGGFQAFTIAVMLSGLLQLVFGLLRAGTIGDYIPNSVIKGMLAAIGIVIILKQIPHALGEDRDFLGDEAFEQADHNNTFTEMLSSFLAPSPGAVLITVISLAVLILWERPALRQQAWTTWLPGPLVCVTLGTLINEAFGQWLPSWQLTAAKFHVVQLPVAGSVREFFGMFTLPQFGRLLHMDTWIVAGTIALVGSIETLLCIEATDKLDPEKRLSDPNRELRAQGIGNFISGLLGGLPITSVIVRSSANVYAGGRTRLACFIHGAVMLFAAAFLASLINRVPLAALASVLLVVGYKLSSRKIILEMWAKGWTQFIPFMVTLVAIVFTDLLKGIAIGLLTSVFFVIRSNHHAAITLVNQDENWLLRFNKDMSFVNKSELKRRLRRVPDGSVVIVDGAKALYVDGDIYETLKEFETAASFRRIRLEYHNFFNKQLASRTH